MGAANPNITFTPQMFGGFTNNTFLVTTFIQAIMDANGGEGDETLEITLLPSTNGSYTVGSENTYTLTITDVPP